METINQVSKKKARSEMGKTHILSIAVIAVLAFSAIATASASAFQWLVGGNPIAVGERWNTDETFAELLFTDMREGIDLLCLGATGLRWLERAGLGMVVEWKCGSIVVDEGTCSSPKLEPVDLPWDTSLTSEGLDTLKEDGKGAPGWLAECTILGVKVDDTCTTENGKGKVENGTEGVTEIFSETIEKSEEGNCTVGGKEEGLLVGKVALEALTANGLETRLLAFS